jgi:hypothetical protein
MNKKKKVDCVKMKAELQDQLMKEYVNNKDKYSSYAGFIRSTASESKEVRAFKDKINKINA